MPRSNPGVATAGRRRGGYTRLAPPLERVGPDYSLLVLYDAVVFLEMLGYILLSLVWGQTVLPNKKDSFFPACEVSIWRVDVPPPSRSASRLWNVRHCWRGSELPLSRRGVPAGDGLSYSSAIRCPSAKLPP